MESESKLIDDMSVGELREAISFEAQRHLLEVETLVNQRQKAMDHLKERKAFFKGLIDRVTSMRVEVCEMEAESPGCSHSKEDDMLTEEEQEPAEQGANHENDAAHGEEGALVSDEALRTGSERVDQFLTKCLTAFSSSKARLDPLLAAMDAAVQPEGTSSGPREGSAFPPTLDPRIKQNLVLYNKTTNVFFVSRNEIRGLKPWWEKHFRSCNACKARHDKWVKAHGLHTHEGFQALPAFARGLGTSGDKRSHRIDVGLTAEPPLDDLESHSVEVFRIAATVAAQKEGKALEDADAVVSNAGELVRKGVQDALKKLASAVVNAPWMRHDDETSTPLSLETKVAVEVFLSSLGSKTTVSVVEGDGASSTAASAGNGAPSTVIRIFVALVLPVHVSCITPLLAAIRVDAQQEVLIERVFEPLIDAVCGAVGLSSKVAFFTSVMRKTLNVFQAFRTQTSPSTGTTGELPQGLKKVVHRVRRKQIYNVLHALAMHKSNVGFTYAMPRKLTTGDAGGSGGIDGALGKRQALDILSEVLKTFVAPDVVMIPADPAIELLEFVVLLERFPTYLLDTLNKIFSSTERVPSSRRVGGGLFDAVVSPQTKISLGLKLFSEMVVDVFRPYAPCCGAIVAEEEEKSQSFFKKSPTLAPPCVPRVEIPHDLVKANVAIHEQATDLLEKLQAERRASQQRELEEQSKRLIARMRERVSSLQIATTIKDEWTNLGITLTSFHEANVSVVLPFGFANSSASGDDEGGAEENDAHSLPLLYVTFGLKESS